MSREQVQLSGGATTYIKPKDLKAGATITGVYRGSFEDKYEKLNHRIEQEDGSQKVINGTGQLNALLAKVAEGTKIDVVYKGTSTIASGQYKGTKAHTFEVYTLKEDSNAAASASVARANPFGI